MMGRTINIAYNADTTNSNDFVAVEVRIGDHIVTEAIAGAIMTLSKSN